jgi:hypothetical protein
LHEEKQYAASESLFRSILSKFEGYTTAADFADTMMRAPKRIGDDDHDGPSKHSGGSGRGSAAAAAAVTSGSMLELALPIHAANGLALVLLESGKGFIGGSSEAADLLRGSLALAERLLGPRSLAAVQSGANLALALRKLGRPCESDEQCRATLVLAVEALGEGSPLVASLRECRVQAILDGGGNLAEASVLSQKLARSSFICAPVSAQGSA